MNDLIEKARDVASACSPLIAKLLNDMADELETMQSRIDESEALKSGWHRWHGGECPVNPHQRVMVMFKDGYGVACDFYWHHCDDDDDIIAYKIIEGKV